MIGEDLSEPGQHPHQFAQKEIARSEEQIEQEQDFGEPRHERGGRAKRCALLSSSEAPWSTAKSDGMCPGVIGVAHHPSSRGARLSARPITARPDGGIAQPARG